MYIAIKIATRPHIAWLPNDPVPAGQPEQDVEIWIQDRALWLDLKDTLENSLIALPGVAQVIAVDYRRDGIYGPGYAPARPAWGDHCLFVFSKAGQKIALNVMALVRQEYDAIKREVAR